MYISRYTLPKKRSKFFNEKFKLDFENIFWNKSALIYDIIFYQKNYLGLGTYSYFKKNMLKLQFISKTLNY